MSDGKATTANATAATIPMAEWLKPELFKDLFRKSINGFKKTKSFKAVPGTPANEHYANLMLRLEFEIELEDGNIKAHSLMIKLCQDSEVFKKLLRNFNFFSAELTMYTHVVPELEQMYRDVGMAVTFGAKGYEINAPVDYVLLENLSPRGFKNVNRLEGLDIEHTHCSLRKLAQWHAASAVRVAVRGPYSDLLTVGLFRDANRPIVADINNGSSKQFLECVATYAGHEEYLTELTALQPKFTDLIFALGKIDSDDFNALNHGDFWMNNVMFQYDATGKVQDTYFVDYQQPKYGSVAQDLLYFLLSSPKLEHKLSKFDSFVKYYHDQLVEHLKLLQYTKPLPKLREIHTSLCKYGFWGYCVVTGVLGIVLTDPTENANVDDFIGESAGSKEYRNQMFSNARYRRQMEVILPWLLNRGVIEI